MGQINNAMQSGDYEMLLIGGGVLQRTPDGKFVAKSAVATYVNELAEYFSPITWATSVDHGPLILDTPLDSRVSFCCVGGTSQTWFSDHLRLTRCVSSDTIILLHMPTPWLALSALMLRKKSKGLFVYLAGNFVEHSRISSDSRGRLYSWLYLKLHHTLIRYSRGVIARGTLLKSIAERFNPNVIETVPIGLISSAPLSREHEPCTQPTVRLLYVGKLITEKGVHVLIEAISILRHLCPDRSFCVQVVGSGELKNALERQVASKNLQNVVSFLGYIDDPKRLSELYLQSDMLVVPSVYPEGVPRVIDEAIIHGIPVVATSVGGIPAQFDNRVVLVPPGDPIALAAGIRRLVEDDVLRGELLKRNQEWMAKNAWQTTAARQHAEFIRRTIEAKL